MGKSEASDVQCQVLTQLYLRIERGTRRNAGMNVGMWRVSGVHGKNAQLVLIISFASFQLSLSLSPSFSGRGFQIPYPGTWDHV